MKDKAWAVEQLRHLYNKVWAVAQLRHLYKLVVSGQVEDAKQAAEGILGPAIEVLEQEEAAHCWKLEWELERELEWLLAVAECEGWW